MLKEEILKTFLMPAFSVPDYIPQCKILTHFLVRFDSHLSKACFTLQFSNWLFDVSPFSNRLYFMAKKYLNTPLTRHLGIGLGFSSECFIKRHRLLAYAKPRGANFWLGQQGNQFLYKRSAKDGSEERITLLPRKCSSI